MKLRQRLATILATTMIMTSVPVVTMGASANRVTKVVTSGNTETALGDKAPEVVIDLKDGWTDSIFYLDLENAEWENSIYTTPQVYGIINGTQVPIGTFERLSKREARIKKKSEYQGYIDEVEEIRISLKNAILKGGDASVIIDGANSEVSNSELIFGRVIGAVGEFELEPIDPIENPAEDNWLSREVARQVGKNIEELTQKDFDQIKVLDIGHQYYVEEIPSQIGNLINLEEFSVWNSGGIKEIPTELRNLTKLIHLSLPQNELNELGVITELTQLEKLYLYGNRNIDVKGIEKLTNLVSLDLGHTGVENLKSIEALIGLRNLGLDGNPELDITGISRYTLLESLDLSNTNLIDISELKTLRGLTNLRLRDNYIEDISCLKGMVKLNSLEISKNKIKDITPLENLNELDVLYLNENMIEDITAIPINLYKRLELKYNYLDLNNELTKSIIDEIVNIGGNIDYMPQKKPIEGNPEKIIDFNDAKFKKIILDQGIDANNDREISIGEMHQLEKLNCRDNNQITDIAGIEYAINLREFRLHSNTTIDITPLGKLVSLESLYLDGIGLENLEVIRNLKQLKWLSISNNNQLNIEGIGELQKLYQLTLNNCGLIDISELSTLSNIGILALNENDIEDISMLKDLPRLDTLQLSDNRITDISSLPENLYKIDLSNNYLDISQNSSTMKIINKLIEQGVRVEYTPQNKPMKPPIGNPEEEIIINDENFRRVLLENGVDLNGDDKITKGEMAKLIRLDSWAMNNDKIRDISGIEYAANLRMIQLVGHEISDISKIAELNGLEYVCFDGYPIDDITPIYNLPNLKSLSLFECNISDISNIAKMEQLEELHLNRNPIKNVNLIFSMNNLKSLNIGDCEIKDITGIEKMKNLQRLGLRGNQGIQLEPIYKLNNLRWLDISDCDVTDISGIEKLKNIESLDLGNNKNLDIRPIGQLLNLRSLGLENCELIDIGVISQLKELQFLNIDNNEISNMDPIYELEKISSLSMENCGLTSIERLNELKELQHVGLSNNNIKNTYGMQGLLDLAELDLSNNNITEVGGLKDLPNLYFLNLSRNEIVDIEQLLQLNDLENLHLEDNYLDLQDGSKAMNNIQELINGGVNVTYQPQREQSKSNNADLSNLILDKGTLNPVFNENTTNYTVTLGNEVESIKINATLEDEKATVIGTGEKVLKVGENIFDIIVTAENETTTKTYRIVVTRGELPKPPTGGGGGGGGAAKPPTTEQVINKLNDIDKQTIVENFKENVPYTTVGSSVTIDQLKALTNNLFTDKQLQEMIENPELLKVLGIDLSILNTQITLTPIKDANFKDVPEKHWANESIKKAAELGLVAGMPDGTFAPSNSLQVADTFTFLDRVLLLNGITEMTLPRSTVEKYITNKEHWAFANIASIGSKLKESTLEIVSKLGDTPISRELLAQVLYEVTNAKLPEVNESIDFKDTQNSLYQDAIDYCVRTGLLNGTGQDKMSPEKALTRAELMTILIRLDEVIK